MGYGLYVDWIVATEERHDRETRQHFLVAKGLAAGSPCLAPGLAGAGLWRLLPGATFGGVSGRPHNPQPPSPNALPSAICDNRRAPSLSGLTTLIGSLEGWRIRAGDYRILYQIDDEA
jgi:hypothetical protein